VLLLCCCVVVLLCFCIAVLLCVLLVCWCAVVLLCCCVVVLCCCVVVLCCCVVLLCCCVVVLLCCCVVVFLCCCVAVLLCSCAVVLLCCCLIVLLCCCVAVLLCYYVLCCCVIVCCACSTECVRMRKITQKSSNSTRTRHVNSLFHAYSLSVLYTRSHCFLHTRSHSAFLYARTLSSLSPPHALSMTDYNLADAIEHLEMSSDYFKTKTMHFPLGIQDQLYQDYLQWRETSTTALPASETATQSAMEATSAPTASPVS
jgi:hypothetical protein